MWRRSLTRQASSARFNHKPTMLILNGGVGGGEADSGLTSGGGPWWPSSELLVCAPHTGRSAHDPG